MNFINQSSKNHDSQSHELKEKDHQQSLIHLWKHSATACCCCPSFTGLHYNCI